ncbi:hypothetical protein Tco_0464810 [Tanacetum coccineum]
MGALLVTKGAWKAKVEVLWGVCYATTELNPQGGDMVPWCQDRALEGASFTQETIPSIPIGGSISREGFLLPIFAVGDDHCYDCDIWMVVVVDIIDDEVVEITRKESYDIEMMFLDRTFPYFKYLRWVEVEDEGWIYFLGGNNSSGIKKYRGSNSSDGGNTRDGVKIAGGVIGLVHGNKFSEELKELLPNEAEK